jgi:acylglycerol lipase
MHSQFNLKRENGMTLSCYCWLPEKTKAFIVIVHGIGEHATRYAKVARALNLAGFAVYSFDLRGHGTSSGKKGHIGSFKTTFDDIEAVIGKALETVGDVPHFLYGHSLGGSIVLAKRMTAHGFALGYIATSPWLELVEAKPKALESASRILRVLLPALTIPTGLNASFLSSDKSVVEEYRNDPLVHARISAATAADVLDYAKIVMEGDSITWERR